MSKADNTQERMINSVEVGEIYGYYGGLLLTVEGEKHYWGIRDWDGIDWQEIPEYLFQAIMQFEGEGYNPAAHD